MNDVLVGECLTTRWDRKYR